MGDVIVVLSILVAITATIKFVDFCERIVNQSDDSKVNAVGEQNVEL